MDGHSLAIHEAWTTNGRSCRSPRQPMIGRPTQFNLKTQYILLKMAPNSPTKITMRIHCFAAFLQLCYLSRQSNGDSNGVFQRSKGPSSTITFRSLLNLLHLPLTIREPLLNFPPEFSWFIIIFPYLNKFYSQKFGFYRVYCFFPRKANLFSSRSLQIRIIWFLN